jgi:hypothetical protein
LNLTYLQQTHLDPIYQKIIHLRKLIIGLIKYLKNK